MKCKRNFLFSLMLLPVIGLTAEIAPNMDFLDAVKKIEQEKGVIYKAKFDNFNMGNKKTFMVSNIEELVSLAEVLTGYHIQISNPNKSKYSNKFPILLSSMDVPRKNDIEKMKLKLKVENYEAETKKLKAINKEILEIEAIKLKTQAEKLKAENEEKLKAEKLKAEKLKAENEEKLKAEKLKAEKLKVEKMKLEKLKAQKEEKISIITFNQLFFFINKQNNNVKNDGYSNLNFNEEILFIKNKIFEISSKNKKIDLLFLENRLNNARTIEELKKLIIELERIK